MDTVILMGRIAATAVLCMLAFGFILAFCLMMIGSVMHFRNVWRSRDMVWSKAKRDDTALMIFFFAFAMVSAAAAALLSEFALIIWR